MDIHSILFAFVMKTPATHCYKNRKCVKCLQEGVDAVKEKIVVIDIKTTGLDPMNDEIIEFAAILIEEEQIVKSIHFLVRPERTVSEKILKFTGINQEELLQAKTLAEYKDEILSLGEDAILVGHNLSQDISILERKLRIQIKNTIWDTLELARIFFPLLKYFRLNSLAEKLQLKKPEQLNGAYADAWLTWHLLQACWNKGLEYDLSFYVQIRKFLLNRPENSFFYNLQKEITRRFPERPVRTDMALNIGKGLFNEPLTQKRFNVSTDWVKNFFTVGGALTKVLPAYESRDGQVVMADAIANALSQSKHLVVEAGTGTGKSLAYLLPAIWWAKLSGKKVLVATHTIPLQEQLQEKDLPLLERALPFSFRSIVLKGKGNYFCLRNWLDFCSGAENLGLEERNASLIVLAWLRETSDGDLQELPQIPGVLRIWPKLSAENCNFAHCPQAGSCFLLRARQKAEETELLIVNHSLLFSDIKTKNNVLPEYNYVIIDEAHHLYQSALEHLGTDLSFERIMRILERLYKHTGPSLLGNIKTHSNYYSAITGNMWEKIKEGIEEIPGHFNLIQDQAQSLFKLLAGIMGDQYSLRMINLHKREKWWTSLEVQVENLSGRLSGLTGVLRVLANILEREKIDELELLRKEISEIENEIKDLIESLPEYLNLENSTQVNWLEKAPNIVWKITPVDISGTLKENFFNKISASILTSATLSISNSFVHFLDELGLTRDTQSLQVDSPFDYENQMQFYVVKGLQKAFKTEPMLPEEVAEFVFEVSRRMGGRTLVLFTSHRFLQETYFNLSELLEKENIQMLGQGIDGSRTTILSEFKRNPQSVLLGASSFWEGVDIIGEALSCVILVKLPFWPPTLPLVEARAEFLEAQGRDPFYELLLPEAIIRFKQGFGRLIRSRDDKGSVIVLDSRIVEKSYGRMFLSSLPVKTHIRGDKGQIIRKLEAWLNR